jgi:phosphoribosylformylglycinamidine synthase
MAFASRCGVTLDLDGICFDAQALDVDGAEKRPNLMAGRDFENIVRALFNEELGALIQIRREDRSKHAAARPACALPFRRHAQRVGRNPHHPQRQARAA